MLQIISIEPGAAGMSYDLRAKGLGYVATVWAGGKNPTDSRARQNAADIKAALDLAANPPKPKAPPQSAFMRGAYSFRPFTCNGRPGFAVYPKGERSHWSKRGEIVQATDGATWLIHSNGAATDARPDFESAVALILQRIGAAS